MTVKELKAFLLTLPDYFDEAEVQSVVHSNPLTAKRVVAYKTKDGSIGLVVNSMGTHLSDEFYANVKERIGTLQ